MDDSAVQRDLSCHETNLPDGVAQALLHYLPEPVALLDHDGVVVFSGGHGAALTEERATLAGRPLFEIVHPDHVIQTVDAFADTRASSGHRTRVRVPVRCADGSYQDFELTMQNIADAAPATGTVAIFLRNVTNRAMAEEALRAAQHRALHDPLTGLSNRVLLLDRLGQECARLRRSGGGLLVMFVDLDGLKAVNDTWGHAAGDELIVSVARRLEQAIRPGDTVARLGGDEFVVVCPDVAERKVRREIPGRLVEAVARPVTLERATIPATVTVTASIGMVEAGDDTDPTDVVRQADSAMYRAKRAGGNRWSF